MGCLGLRRTPPPRAAPATMREGERSRPPGRSPKFPLNFHTARPDTSGLKEQSPKGASVPLGRTPGGARSPRPGRQGPRGSTLRPHGASPRPARPSLHRACDTQASAAPPPSFARLPFKREAQLDLCRPR